MKQIATRVVAQTRTAHASASKSPAQIGRHAPLEVAWRDAKPSIQQRTKQVEFFIVAKRRGDLNS
jgi:hypothetical protein